MARNCKFGESGPVGVIREGQFLARQSEFPMEQTGLRKAETAVPDAAIPVPNFGKIRRSKVRLEEIIRFAGAP
jgi:hypothetical protein